VRVWVGGWVGVGELVGCRFVHMGGWGGYYIL
jgi:hypothetical protein